MDCEPGILLYREDRARIHTTGDGAIDGAYAGPALAIIGDSPSLKALVISCNNINI